MAQKRIYEDNQSKKNQKTLETTLLAADSKREVIEELIKAFASANIPIEKINHLLPFFKKYLKEGDAIPQAQLYVNCTYLLSLKIMQKSSFQFLIQSLFVS